MRQRARLTSSKDATPSDFRDETLWAQSLRLVLSACLENPTFSDHTGFRSDLRCGPAYSNKRTRASDGSDRAWAGCDWRYSLFATEPLEIIEHSGNELLSAGVLRGEGAGEKIDIAPSRRLRANSYTALQAGELPIRPVEGARLSR